MRPKNGAGWSKHPERSRSRVRDARVRGEDKPRHHRCYAEDSSTAARAQSIDTPLALIGAAHFAISAGMNVARYAGLRRSGATTVTPTLSSRSRTAGESRASLVALASRCTATADVPL